MHQGIVFIFRRPHIAIIVYNESSETVKNWVNMCEKAQKQNKDNVFLVLPQAFKKDNYIDRWTKTVCQ